MKNTVEGSNMENTKTESQKAKVISNGNLYGSGEEGIDAQNLVITNQEDWEKLIRQMNSVNNISDSFTETKIDFTKFMIIAVFDAVKTSGGHSIQLDIRPNSENVVVVVTRLAPQGMATSVMTQPYNIVKISKQNLPIVFQ